MSTSSGDRTMPSLTIKLASTSIGKNAEVSVAKALDLAEAVDALRFQVQQFFADHASVTTDALIAKLNAVFDGIVPESLRHLGPAVLSPLATTDAAIASTDVFEFHLALDSNTVTVKVDVDASPVPAVVGNVVTVGASALTVDGVCGSGRGVRRFQEVFGRG